VALQPSFDRLFPKLVKPTHNSFITALLRMVA